MFAQGAHPTSSAGSKEPFFVYVVDDEPLIGEVIESILRAEGFRVETFSDPQVAFQAFLNAKKRPDALLTDYVMKPLNGMELFQKCRAIEPALTTILFSGNVTAQILDLFVQKPNAFIEKPFQPKELVPILRNLLSKMPSAGGDSPTLIQRRPRK